MAWRPKTAAHEWQNAGISLDKLYPARAFTASATQAIATTTMGFCFKGRCFRLV